MFDAPPPQEEKAYDLVLHSAELGAAAPGRRVCDFRVQSETVIKGLDVAQEDGGTLRPLTRRVSGTLGSTMLEIEFAS